MTEEKKIKKKMAESNWILCELSNCSFWIHVELYKWKNDITYG